MGFNQRESSTEEVGTSQGITKEKGIVTGSEGENCSGDESPLGGEEGKQRGKISYLRLGTVDSPGYFRGECSTRFWHIRENAPVVKRFTPPTIGRSRRIAGNPPQKSRPTTPGVVHQRPNAQRVLWLS